MKKKLNILRLFYFLFKISRNPKETSAVFGIADCMRKLGLIQELTKKAALSPDCVNLISERKLLKAVNLSELKNMSVGTLGRAYADHMISQNLSQEFYEVLEIKNDEAYIMMRMRQTHDLWHVVTGFDTSVSNELGLQAFMMAQAHSPVSPILIGGQLIISAIRNPTEAREIVDQITRGWIMGKTARPIFAIDWEAQWSTPVESLRYNYRVVTSELKGREADHPSTKISD